RTAGGADSRTGRRNRPAAQRARGARRRPAASGSKAERLHARVSRIFRQSSGRERSRSIATAWRSARTTTWRTTNWAAPSPTPAAATKPRKSLPPRSKSTPTSATRAASSRPSAPTADSVCVPFQNNRRISMRTLLVWSFSLFLWPAIAAGAVIVKAVGIDTPSIDHGPSQDFPVHRIHGAANVPIDVNVGALERLPAHEAAIFALPMKIEGGSGAPLAIFALL